MSAVRNLPPDSATGRAELGDRIDWGHLAANVAELVDLMNYQVNADYQQWVTDPDDPAVKADRDYRKKNKIKPPPVPLVPPVAFRPGSVAAEYREAFAELVAKYEPTRTPLDGLPTAPGRRWVTSTSEVDRILDLL